MIMFDTESVQNKSNNSPSQQSKFEQKCQTVFSSSIILIFKCEQDKSLTQRNIIWGYKKNVIHRQEILFSDASHRQTLLTHLHPS